jgi:hypothetical protein
VFVLLAMSLLAAEAQAYVSGDLIWAKKVGTATSPAGTSISLSSGHNVAAGPNGTTVVAGWKIADPPGIVASVAKYNALGERQWLSRYMDVAGWANAVAVDRNGNVYVAARLGGRVAINDIGLLKYGSDGSLRWARTYDGAAANEDEPVALVIDHAQNVVVVGRSYAENGRQGIVVLKYLPNGTLAWPAVRYDSDPADADADSPFATSVAVDGDDNIYVTGWSRYWLRGVLTSSALPLKFAGDDGERRWARLYEARNNAHSYAYEITVRGTTLVITGSTQGDPGHSDGLVVRYSLTGTEKYGREWGAGNDLGEELGGVKVDGGGNVFVTGHQALHTPDGYSQAVTMKLDPSLLTVWKQTYRPTTSVAQGLYLVRDGLGDVFVSGVRRNSDGFDDFLTMKYSPTGVRKWLRTWSGGGPGDDVPGGLVLSTTGGVHVGGETSAPDDFPQAILLKYQQ